MASPFSPVPAPGADSPAAGGRWVRAVGIVLLAVVGLAVAGLVAAVLAAPKPAPAEAVRPAPPLQLSDQDGQPFDLASLRGRPVLVFFGYTHCPDVCPATVGTLNEALAKVGPGPRVVFVSIDPERDDPAALKSYLRYLPPAYLGLTGTAADVRQTATAWGIQYAKQMNTTGGYSMAHTAVVFLVDAQGRIRTTFPFGTTAEPIAAALSGLLAETPPPAATSSPIAASSVQPAIPSPSWAATSSAASAASSSSSSSSPAASSPASPATGASTVPGAGGLQAQVVSSEVWAGGPDPVILTIADASGAQLDGTVPVEVTVTGAGNAPAAPTARAVAVQPWGETTVYFVATVTIPSPGGWRLALSTAAGATGSVAVTAQDQGATTPLGALAPDVHTPTLADVGGVVRAVTTQPEPDLRLSTRSTSDARAQGKPYVLVIDSARFRVSQLCGKAIVMVGYLLDRWSDSVVFAQLEPFVYSIVTDEPVLSGDIANPPLNQWAQAYGLGPAPWTALTVPWVFVVDGQGVVRAKYQGIVGTADVDVIISLIEHNGVIGGS